MSAFKIIRGFISALFDWYQHSFKNKVLFSVVVTFVIIYGITLNLVYHRTASDLFRTAKNEALSMTAILAMAVYRSYDLETDSREIQGFIAGAQSYHDRFLQIDVLNRQLWVLGSTQDANLQTTQPAARYQHALANSAQFEFHTDKPIPHIRIIHPISAGPDKTHFVRGIIDLRMDISEQIAALNRLQFYTVIAGVLIIGVMIVVLSRISSSLTKPINRLYQGMAMVNDQNLEVHVDVTSQDEIGFLTESFNRMLASIRQSRHHLEALMMASIRFVPAQFLELLDKKDITDVQLGDAQFKSITILFMDIRDFTRMSQNMSAGDVLYFLNTLMQFLLPAIEKHAGFVDKYIGDAIMAIFAQQTDDAVLASVTMQQAVSHFNALRKKQGLEPIKMGIGINCGEAIVGTIGSRQRLDTTVIGNTVNIASRIEGLSKTTNFPILIADDVYQQLKPETLKQFDIQEAGLFEVKGIDQPIKLYGLCV